MSAINETPTAINSGSDNPLDTNLTTALPLTIRTAVPFDVNIYTTSTPITPIVPPQLPLNVIPTSDWELRKKIIYHFYAYHYFEKSVASEQHGPTSIFTVPLDLINMKDADLQFLWRTADMVKGLKSQYKLAEYLVRAKDEVAHVQANIQIDTHRKRLLFKVREYNCGKHGRDRFYFRGLRDCDWEFLEGLNAGTGVSGPKRGLERISSGCGETVWDEKSRENWDGEMENAIEKSIESSLSATIAERLRTSEM